MKDEWYLCNDTQVSKVTVKEVERCEAYLLVYGKVSS